MRSEPKIDFTYSGQKKVDLGFGASPAAAPASLQGPPPLTWEAMRKVLQLMHASFPPFSEAASLAVCTFRTPSSQVMCSYQSPQALQNVISWCGELMQVGAGFWLRGAQAVRKQAEALAKAQFAARRDPHDCALLYIALGRRALLQVNLPVTCSPSACAQNERFICSSRTQP